MKYKEKILLTPLKTIIFYKCPCCDKSLVLELIYNHDKKKFNVGAHQTNDKECLDIPFDAIYE